MSRSRPVAIRQTSILVRRKGEHDFPYAINHPIAGIRRNVFSPQTSIHFLYVLAVPMAAAISSFSLPLVEGLRLSGLLWILMLIAGVGLLLGSHRRLVFPKAIWLPWYLLMGVSFLWSERTIRPNLQDCVQILSPLVVGLVASCVWYDERMLRRIFRAFVFCSLFIAALSILDGGFGASDQPLPQTESEAEAGAGFAARGASMTMCIAACVHLARVNQMPVRCILGWLFCFGVAVFTGSRMASFAILTLLVAIPRYQRIGGRKLAFALVFIAGLVAFSSRAMQNRFLMSQSNSLAEVDLTDAQVSAGRSTAWPLIWEEAMQKPLLGHGVGSSVFFVSEIWPNIDKPHNDYLRVLFETGFPGLILFVSAIVLQLQDLWKTARGDTNSTNWPATAAFLGIWSLALLAITDNPILYNIMYMNPLFALLGMAYSLRNRPLIRYGRISAARQNVTISESNAS